ncbi:MAG TPA: hypothetical protein VLW55_23000 [Burkholderiaceae bacterium]|nr:hypothetical protein [Burkholderiaceae bacterium]
MSSLPIRLGADLGLTWLRHARDRPLNAFLSIFMSNPSKVW